MCNVDRTHEEKYIVYFVFLKEKTHTLSEFNVFIKFFVVFNLYLFMLDCVCFNSHTSLGLPKRSV